MGRARLVGQLTRDRALNRLTAVNCTLARRDCCMDNAHLVLDPAIWAIRTLSFAVCATSDAMEEGAPAITVLQCP